MLINGVNQLKNDHTTIMDIRDLDVADSVLDLIGKTPLVRLPRIGDGVPCPVVAKLETTNPGGSSKDRPALTMIDEAEKAGLLQPGGTIIEPTSGNTGVGLAIVAAQRGYKCIFVMTDKVSSEKVTLLEAYGAEVVVCPVAVAPDDPRSYYSTAERLVKEVPNIEYQYEGVAANIRAYLSPSLATLSRLEVDPSRLLPVVAFFVRVQSGVFSLRALARASDFFPPTRCSDCCSCSRYRPPLH